MTSPRDLSEKNENARLEVLRRYDILDTPEEAVFDDFTKLASYICQTPLALISLVDADRQWFKSKVGLEVRETSRDISFCSHALSSHDTFIVPDAQLDERFAKNPLVTDGPQIRFYAGAPLVTPEGETMGTLCVIDRVPRTITPEQNEALQALSRQVVAQMEHRRSLRLLEAEMQQKELAQQQYRTLVENASDLIYWADEHGKFQTFNATATPLTEYSHDELVGRNYIELVHPDYRRATRSFYRTQLLQKNINSYYELPMVTRSGRTVWLGQNVHLFLDNGKVKGFQAVARDITERKSVEMALRQSENRFKSFMNNSPTLAFIKDEAGRYLYINAPIEKHFNITLDELKGKTDFEWLPHDVAVQLTANDRATLESKSTIETVEVVPTPDGDVRYWLSYKFPLSEPSGERLLGGVSIDITALRQAEQDAVEARDLAQEASRQKSQFLANMSHEIRTPMNGVIGMTGLLQDTHLSAEQKDFVDTIHSSADSLLDIINDILDFSKIESGKMLLEPNDFSIHSLTEGVLDLMAERAQAKNLEIASFVAPDVPRNLRGDSGRLRQILTNLLGNAIKFTQRGTVVLRVSAVNADDTFPTLRFEVQDSGIGISEEAQSRLFQPFSQADNSTTRKYGGTGLGLAISRQLVELMGGEIGVESQPSQGSTFWFTVRLEKTETALSTTLHATDFHNLRVLIVDDNSVNRRILKEIVASWGMTSTEVGGAIAALTAMQVATQLGQPFDLALIDLIMPETDGLMLAEQIKNDPSLRATRLILLSSLGHRIQPDALEAAGIESQLSKPVKQSQLFDCIASLIFQDEPVGDENKESTSTSPPDAQTTHDRVLVSDVDLNAAKLNARILVAEDNAVNQKVAQRQLQKLGYNADVVANGLEVLEAIKLVPYDVILMDCQMPEMDGYEATGAIRQKEDQNRHIPIIAMTANALKGDREKCLAAGMDDYISKPVNTEALASVLQRWVTQRRERQQSEDSESESSESVKSPANEVVEIVTDATVQLDVTPKMYRAAIEPERLKEYDEWSDEEAENLVVTMIDLFLNDAVSYESRLSEAVSQQDATAVEKTAHALKGSAAHFGAKEVVELCIRLEEQGRERKLNESRATFQLLQRALVLVRRALQEERDERAPKSGQT